MNTLLTILFFLLSPFHPQTESNSNIRDELKASCEGLVNLPEYCLRIYAQGGNFHYEEFLTIAWGESTFATWKTNTANIWPGGASGLVQIAWHPNAGFLERLGYTRDDLYDAEKVVEIIPYIQRHGMFKYMNRNVAFPDWEAYWDYVLNDTDLYDLESVPPEIRWHDWDVKERFGTPREHEWKLNHAGIWDPELSELQAVADSLEWILPTPHTQAPLLIPGDRPQ